MKGNIRSKTTFTREKEAILEVKTEVKITWTVYLLTINTKNKASDKILPYFSLLRRKKKLFNFANISEFFLHAR